jgi:hypothetical protein
MLNPSIEDFHAVNYGVQNASVLQDEGQGHHEHVGQIGFICPPLASDCSARRRIPSATLLYVALSVSSQTSVASGTRVRLLAMMLSSFSMSYFG